jgi:hypothetical protein
MRKKSETLHFRLSPEYWRVVTELSARTGATVSDIARSALAQLCVASVDEQGYMREEIVTALSQQFGVSEAPGGVRKKGRPLSAEKKKWCAALPSLWEQPQAATPPPITLAPITPVAVESIAPTTAPAGIVIYYDLDLTEEEEEKSRAILAKYSKASGTIDKAIKFQQKKEGCKVVEVAMRLIYISIERLATRLSTQDIKEYSSKTIGHAITHAYMLEMSIECIIYRINEAAAGRLQCDPQTIPANLDRKLVDRVAYAIAGQFSFSEIHAMPIEQLVRIFIQAILAGEEASKWYAQQIAEATPNYKPRMQQTPTMVPPAEEEEDGPPDNSGFIPSAGCSLSERIEERFAEIRNHIRFDSEDGKIDEDAFNEAYIQLESLPFGERKLLVHAPVEELIAAFLKMYNVAVKRASNKQRKRRESNLSDKLTDYISAKKAQENGNDN